jgi:hypothetical protein
MPKISGGGARGNSSPPPIRARCSARTRNQQPDLPINVAWPRRWPVRHCWASALSERLTYRITRINR